MTSTVLGITAADVRKKLNPLAEPHLFSYGTGYEILEADVDDVIQEREDYVLSRVPEKYRKLLRHIDGEIVCSYATPGQTTVLLGLTGASNIKIFVNYPSGLPWVDRSLAYETASTEWTYDTEANTVTFATALNEADTVRAEYDHTAATACKVLKTITLNLVAAEWARRLPMPPEHFDKFRDWEVQAYSDLKRMHERGDGKLGIDMFDHLKLVQETRAQESTMGTPALGGW